MFKFPVEFMSKHTLRQALLGSISLVRGGNTGGIFGFTNVLLYQLEYDESFSLSPEQTSWITLLIITSIIISALVSSLIIEVLGRRKTLLLMESVTLTSWLLIFYCENFTMLAAACILVGISMGIFFPAEITFLGEISTPQYRTTLLTLPNLGLNFGYCLCTFLGDYIHWRIFGAIFAFFSIFDIINLLYIKESFVTYLDKGDIEKARQNYHWFRGNGPQSDEEFQDILNTKASSKTNTYYQKIKQCTTREFITPSCITVVIYLANKFSGVQAIVYCTQEIIQEINKEPSFLNSALVILSVVRVVTIISSLFIVQLFSARFMILSSGYLLSVSLLALGGFMYCTKIYDNPVFPILALVALVMNVILFCVGLGAFTWVICGEIFPHATRTIGISIGVSLAYLFLIGFAHFLPSLITYVGGYGTMTMFGFCTFFSSIVMHFTLPQTKNKTLIEINRTYQG